MEHDDAQSHGHGHGHEQGRGLAHAHGHAHGHGQIDDADWEAWAEHTELDGEVLISFVTEVAARVGSLRRPDAGPVLRIVDIGSGPGVATCELARCCPAATAVAVDGSAGMLHRADRRIIAHALTERVTTRLAALPAELLDLAAPGTVDLIWASMSLHHMGDEVATLRGLRELLADDGLLAIVEIAEPTAMTPSRLGLDMPDLDERLSAASHAWFAAMRASLPDAVESADLASMVTTAGLDVLDDHIAEVTLDPPLSAPARQVVLGHLQRTRDQLRDMLEPGALAELDLLCDPDDPRGVLRAPDVVLRASRRVVIAARGSAR